MASGSALFSIKIIADAQKAKKELDGVGGKLDKLEGHAKKGAAAMGVASGAVVALGKQAFDAASDLQQSTGAVESIYKEQSHQIANLAASADKAVGLSKNQYQELASVMGAQLKNMGVSSDELVGQTDELITKGADLAATFGGTTADAVGALSSLMKGEADPIERYGISIKESNIQAELAAQGLDKLEGEAGKTARTQAIMKLLTEQSSDAVGAFARESDTAAGQQQRATAAWENAKATLGEALLPVVAQAAEKLGAVSKWVGEHPRQFQAAAVAIVATAGVLGGLVTTIKIVKNVTMAWKTAQQLLNVALKNNPVGLAITVIGILVGAFILAYKNSETFRNAVNALGRSLKSVFTAAVQWCKDMAAGISRGYESIKQSVSNAINAVKQWWRDGWKHITELAHNATKWVLDALRPIFDFRDKVAAVFDRIGKGISNVIDRIRDAIEWVRDLVDSIPGVGAVSRAVGNIFAGQSGALITTVAPMMDSHVIRAVPRAPDVTAALAPRRVARLALARSLSLPSPTVINVTVNGAVDPFSTGRQIKELLDNYELQDRW